MKNWRLYAISILVSMIITFGSLLIVVNLPLDTFSSKQTLGSTLVTINGSDKIKDLPTSLNANFTALNNGKIEVSTTTLNQVTTMTSLASIGTITSGTWNGTAIPFAKGGTGTTTIQDRLILMGNGAGLAVVATGTEGQLLSIVGGVPRWASPSVDTSIAYTWSGTHNFINYASTSKMYIDSIDADVLVSQATTTLHHHPMASGQVSSTTPSAGDMVITHNLGVTPTLIKLTSITNYTGAGAAKTISYGTANPYGGTETHFISDGTTLTAGQSANTIIRAYTSAGSSVTDANITAVTATTFTINFANMGAGAIYIQWEAYR